MWFGQLPAPSGADFGNWMIGLVALMGVLLLGRNLWLSFFPTPLARAREDEWVTQKELQIAVVELRTEIRNDINTAIRVLTDKMTEKFDSYREQQLDLKEKIKDLSDYQHKTAHETSNSLNVLALKMTELAAVVEWGPKHKKAGAES